MTATHDRRPVLTLDQWQALKLASIRGVSDPELARSFGVLEGTIRKRRFDDPGWKAALATRKTVTPPVTLPPKVDENKLSEVISDNLEAIAQRNPLLLGRYLAKKIETTVKNDLIPDPSTLQELQIADNMLRKQTGQDKEQPAVTVNLWGAEASFQDSGEWREVESACSPEQEDWV